LKYLGNSRKKRRAKSRRKSNENNLIASKTKVTSES